jgi:hypothetical protein
MNTKTRLSQQVVKTKVLENKHSSASKVKYWRKFESQSLQKNKRTVALKAFKTPKHT